ncbi:adenylyltransferase/cytidyltransferase family protein, partial [Longimonas sp.]|uniref:adenylyltransferase/cytidyltransferase family protein n=1 Tax=Longimonas sp. TaxID=2039626 RepID=UPI003975FA41
MDVTTGEDVVFFPGSFDPFSLGHREIAKEIRRRGFEVYLAVDEFSWSKRTEAHQFRRNIINMSIAKEDGIYLFPKEIPINLKSDSDMI